MTSDDLRVRFEALLGRFEASALVVTAGTVTEQAGCLVTFHCQVSIRPHRYLVALSPQNHTTALAAACGRVAVHVLPAGRRDLAVTFGGCCSVEDRTFERIAWRPWRDAGPPLLGDAAGWFVGSVAARHRVGDHDAHVLDVEDASTASRHGDLLHVSAIGHLTAGHAP